MNVPLLDLQGQYQLLKNEILPQVEELMESQLFVLGAPVKKLEQEVAAYCGAEYGIGVASGSDALLLSLMAAGIGTGDEVMTTPYTFFATVSAITRLGARPVFVDIDPVYYNLDVAQVESRITEKTRAILPVHLFGQAADMDPLMQIASRHDLSIIEDAAQAIGAEYKGRKVGALGDTGCFSFFPSKNLGGFGDGGMVVTNRMDLAETIRSLHVHGMGREQYVHDHVGINSRLDALQAVVLSVKLKYLDQWHRARRENAVRYGSLFEQAGLLEDKPIILPKEIYAEEASDTSANIHIYNQYVIRTRDRDALKDYLAEQSIGTAIYYPISLHLQKCFSFLGYREGDFPESERASQETLALPIYPELTEEMQAHVVDSIHSFYSR